MLYGLVKPFKMNFLLYANFIKLYGYINILLWMYIDTKNKYIKLHKLYKNLLKKYWLLQDILIYLLQKAGEKAFGNINKKEI